MKTILYFLYLSGILFFGCCTNVAYSKKQEPVQETLDFLTAGYVWNDPQTTIPATIDLDKSLTTLEISGRHYHGEVYGKPGHPVVVIVHGGPGADYRALLTLKQLTESNFFVIFYDQMGTGLSPRIASESINFDASIKELKEIADKYAGSSKVNLIGHSFGGQLVSAFTAKYPEKVDHLILAEPGPLNQEMSVIGPVTGFSPALLLPGMIAQFEQMHIQGPDADAPEDYFFGRMAIQANPGYWCGGKAPESAKGWRFGSRANSATVSSMQENGKLKNLIHGIENFKQKVLFITSSCNTVIGKSFQQEQMKLFPFSEISEISDSGHEMFSENPTASLSTVRSFLVRSL